MDIQKEKTRVTLGGNLSSSQSQFYKKILTQIFIKCNQKLSNHPSTNAPEIYDIEIISISFGTPENNVRPKKFHRKNSRDNFQYIGETNHEQPMAK